MQDLIRGRLSASLVNCLASSSYPLSIDLSWALAAAGLGALAAGFLSAFGSGFLGAAFLASFLAGAFLAGAFAGAAFFAGAASSVWSSS